MAAELVPVLDRGHRDALDRPDRQRAVGGGDTFDRTTADHLLLTVLWLRQYPTDEVLGFLFGVSDSTASRTRSRVRPHREKAGKDTMRMPDPGVGRRKKRPALLNDTPGLAVVIDSFEQRTHRPKRSQRAYDSGQRKAHTRKSQAGADEESGRVVDVSDSVPGRWADIKWLDRSRLRKRLPDGVGALGDSGDQGIADRHPPGRARGARRAGRSDRRRTANTAGHSAGVGSWSGMRSGGCGGIRRSPR